MRSSVEREPLPRGEFTLFDQLPQSLYLFSKDRALADGYFEPVELGWIMTSRHHHPAVLVEMEEGKIENGGRTDSDVDDMTSCRNQTAEQCLSKALRTEPSVSAHGQVLHAQADHVGSKPLAQSSDNLGGQIPIDDAPNIVLPEDKRVHFHLRTSFSRTDSTRLS